MDLKGQAAVLLSAFVLVGMVFLVPAITEKALAINRGEARGTCGPEGQTQPCEFTWFNGALHAGQWGPGGTPTGWGSKSPVKSPVSWFTTGATSSGFREDGWVQYEVGQHREVNRVNQQWAAELGHGQSPEMGYSAKLFFTNPTFGANTCNVEIYDPQMHLQAPGKGPVTGSCKVFGNNPSDMIYTITSTYK